MIQETDSTTLLQERLNNILLFLEEGIKNTGTFIGEQTPIVIQEIIHWYATSCIYWMIFGSFFLMLNYIVRRARISGEINLDDSDDFGLWFVTNILGLIFWGGFFFTNLYDLLKVIVAPRLVLIDYVKEIVK